MQAVHTQNLMKSYGTHQALKGVNLAIKEGKFYALMGPNGSGKSTLASILCSVITFDTGTIEIYGQKPEQARRWTGYIPQDNFPVELLNLFSLTKVISSNKPVMCYSINPSEELMWFNYRILRAEFALF